MASPSTDGQEWFCYMMVTNDFADQLNKLKQSIKDHELHKKHESDPLLRKSRSLDRHDLCSFQRKYVLAGKYKSCPNPESNLTACTLNCVSDENNITNETDALQFIIKECKKNCTTDNSESSSSETKEKTKKQKSSDIPKRTILGCSKYPFHDMVLFNQHGPSRSSDFNGALQRTATGAINPRSLSLYPRKMDGETDSPHHFGEHGLFSTGSSLGGSILSTAGHMKRKPRMRKKPPLQYCMALIIAGFGNNAEKAMKFYEMWNEKSRGPIPRAAKGTYLAKKMGLETYGDYEVIFNHDCNFFNIISEESKLVFSVKDEYKDMFPVEMLEEYEKKDYSALLSSLNEPNEEGSTSSGKKRKPRKRKRKQISIVTEIDDSNSSNPVDSTEEPTKKRRRIQ